MGQYKFWKLRLMCMPLVGNGLYILSHTWRYWCCVDSREGRWLEVSHFESPQTLLHASLYLADFNLCLLTVKPCVTIHTTALVSSVSCSSKLLKLTVVWRITTPHLPLVAKVKVVLCEPHAFKLGLILGIIATVRKGTSIQLMLHNQYLRGLI